MSLPCPQESHLSGVSPSVIVHSKHFSHLKAGILIPQTICLLMFQSLRFFSQCLAIFSKRLAVNLTSPLVIPERALLARGLILINHCLERRGSIKPLSLSQTPTT